MRKQDHLPATGIDSATVRKFTGLRPFNFVSIDPGDIHVGWVRWENCVPAHLEELTPDECIKQLEFLEGQEAIVLEDWRLYADKANTMIGSDMPTCQLIGVIKYLAKQRGIPILMQGAGLRKPIEGVLRNKGIQLYSRKLQLSDHVQDAELHGWTFLWNGHKRFERAYGVSFKETA